MLKIIKLNLLILISAVLTLSASAQELQLPDLQRNINIFSGVLEEALDFAEAKGLFGLSLGGIDSIYLIGQGVVLEVRTPLANSRNKMNLASLSTAMQSLQVRGNPFEAIALSQAALKQASAVSMTSNAETTESSGFYAEMMEKISNIDYALVVNNAIQQASESARSLHSLGSVNGSDYEQLRTDIEALRTDVQESMHGLRQIESELRELTTAAISLPNIEDNLRHKLDELMTRTEPLREQAIAKAAELRKRSDTAEQAYAQQWRQDVIDFEDRLYQAMCDYGSTLRELPTQESVSIILTGLGEQAEDQHRTDKIHVFSKADLLQCQSGDITAITLEQRSSQYSY